MSTLTGTKAERSRSFIELLDRIRIIEDARAEEALLEELTRPTRPFIVSFVNAHAANLGWNEPGMLESLRRSDLLLRDGIGVKLGMRALSRPYGVNMNGTDLIPKIAKAYRGRRVALFGTSSPWLETARGRLEQEMGLEVVACHDGFAPQEKYLELAVAAKPELIILAMGMPKQEQVAVKLRELLTHPVLIVNGGAILDFLAGKVARAPLWMRKTGLEWSYRLWLEPKRLFRRYVLGIPVFFSHVMEARVRGQASKQGGGTG
jgi:hypothetical protein